MKQEYFSNTTQGKNRENLSNKGKSLPPSLQFEIGLPCEIASKFHRVNVAKQIVIQKRASGRNLDTRKALAVLRS